MASVAGVSFDRLEGAVQAAARTIRNITQPRAEGDTLRDEGLHAKPYRLTGMRGYVSFASYETGYAAWLALVGTRVTVVDEGGVTWLNQVLMDVQRLAPRAIGANAGSVQAGATVWGGVRLTLIDKRST
jgi:hypothetical protein